MKGAQEKKKKDKCLSMCQNLYLYASINRKKKSKKKTSFKVNSCTSTCHSNLPSTQQILHKTSFSPPTPLPEKQNKFTTQTDAWPKKKKPSGDMLEYNGFSLSSKGYQDFLYVGFLLSDGFAQHNLNHY